MLYNDHLIASVQDANDILDIVGEYVSPLKKKGSNYWGVCPFHSEKTPSFSVNPAKKIFKCFGCGKGGSVFNFIMEIEGLSFPEAIRLLAEKAHIDLPTQEQKEFAGSSVEDNLYEVNRWAAKIFHENLKKPDGKSAREYFQKRGITPETQVKFGLGYSFPGWDDLKSHAYHDQVRTEYVEQSGLIIRKEDGGYYDRFRDRVMFPIQDAVGRVLGFTARILTNDKEQAKYINSPESAIYHKGKVLFGLFHAKDEIRKRDEVILVEGNLDVISLHQADIKNVVATSGTALTLDQIKLVKRYTKRNFIFLYDGDDAGLKAMERSIELLFEEGLFPQIVSLPDQHDPDSFVQKFGRDEFLKFIKSNRKSFLEFINDYESSKIDITDVTSKKELINRLVSLIAKFNDPVGREFMIKEVARFSSVTESVLTTELNKKFTENKKQQERIPLSKKEFSGAPLPVPKSSVKLSVSEQDLLKVVTDYGKVMLEYLSFFIEPNHFQHEVAKQIYLKLLQYFQTTDDWELSLFIEQCTDEEKDMMLRISMEKYSISPKWKELGFDKSMLNHEKWVQDAIIELRMSFIARSIETIRNEMKSTSDDDRMTELLSMQNELQKERESLITRKIFDFESET